MSVAPLVSLPHPLVGGVVAIENALDGMPIGGWPGLEPELVRELAERMMRAEARLKAHQLAATRALEASGLAKKSGAASTGAMLAKGFGGDRRAAEAMVHKGKALEAAPATEEALAGGRIGEAQAGIIAGAIGDLPDGTTAEQKQACEDTLIGDAPKYNLKDLRSRSKRITDQFKPEPEVDAEENENLEATEKRAWKRSEFWMKANGDGTTSGGFKVPDAQADMLEAAIKSICAPKRDHLRDHPGAKADDGKAEDQATGEASGSKAGHSFYDRELEWRTRMGVGFAELCAHLPGNLLPGRSGFGATLMVRLDLDTLIHGVKAATLSTGTRISAAQARLMACNLGIIPQVFGGKSVPSDHGHEQRQFTRAQKQALAARDHGCTFPGCDRPPEESEGHHWRMDWAKGATTHLDDGALICPHHHRVVHADNWSTRLGPTGVIEYRAPGSTIWTRNHRWRP